MKIKKSEKRIIYNGESKNITQWAEKIGISTSAFRKRFEKYNGDMDKVIHTPIREQKTYCYKGKRISLSEIAEMNGSISVPTACRWLSRGMSIEEVINTPLRRVSRKYSVKAKDTRPSGCTEPECEKCPYDDCRW